MISLEHPSDSWSCEFVAVVLLSHLLLGRLDPFLWEETRKMTLKI